MKYTIYVTVLLSLFSAAYAPKPKHGLGARRFSQFRNLAKYKSPFPPSKSEKNLAAVQAYVVPAPPPGDQLTDGSYVAWAVGYTFFSSYLQRHLHPTWNSDNEISLGFLYHFIRIQDNCDSGTNIPRALEAITNIGACMMKSWPYVSNGCRALPTNQQLVEAMTYRSPWGDPQATNDPPLQKLGKRRLPPGVIQFWTTITPTSVSDYKDFLQQYNWPIIVAFNVNTSFDLMWATTGIWTQNTGAIRGGHAVCVVGWDDNKQFNGKKGMFKCQNQWGTNGGDKGYFWVTYDMIASGCFLEAYGWTRDEPADKKPAPVVLPPGTPHPNFGDAKGGKN